MPLLFRARPSQSATSWWCWIGALFGKSLGVCGPQNADVSHRLTRQESQLMGVISAEGAMSTLLNIHRISTTCICSKLGWDCDVLAMSRVLVLGVLRRHRTLRILLFGYMPSMTQETPRLRATRSQRGRKSKEAGAQKWRSTVLLSSTHSSRKGGLLPDHFFRFYTCIITITMFVIEYK